MTARFRFRLQSVLDHRTRREELMQQELAQSLRALGAQQERAVAAERAVELELAALRGLMTGPIELHTLRQKHADLALARARAAHERAAADRLEAVAAERREELVGASRDRKAMDQLRETAHERHRREALRLEGIALDELAGQLGRRRVGATS